MWKLFSLDDYYLGLILAHPSYYTNPERKKRCKYEYADPFSGMVLEQAMIFGVVTLLRKKGDHYYDEDYSIYENELAYQLGKTNSLGISLAYVKPFCDVYHENPTTYIQEDVLENFEVLEEMALTHSYYIMHSKLTKKNAIVINVCEPMESVRYEYMRNVMGEEAFADMWQGQMVKEKVQDKTSLDN